VSTKYEHPIASCYLLLRTRRSQEFALENEKITKMTAPIWFLIRFSPFFQLSYATGPTTQPSRKGILKPVSDEVPEERKAIISLKTLEEIGAYKEPWDGVGPLRIHRVNKERVRDFRENRLVTLRENASEMAATATVLLDKPSSPATFLVDESGERLEPPEKRHAWFSNYIDIDKQTFVESGGPSKLFGIESNTTEAFSSGDRFTTLDTSRQDKIANLIAEFYRVGRTYTSAGIRALSIRRKFRSCFSGTVTKNRVDNPMRRSYYLSSYENDGTDYVRARPDDVADTAYSVMHLEFREVEEELTKKGWTSYYVTTSIRNKVKEFNDVGVSTMSKSLQNVRGFFRRKVRKNSIDDRNTVETVPRHALLFVVTHVDSITDSLIFVKRNDRSPFTLNDLKKLDWAKDMVQSLVDTSGV